MEGGREGAAPAGAISVRDRRGRKQRKLPFRRCYSPGREQKSGELRVWPPLEPTHLGPPRRAFRDRRLYVSIGTSQGPWARVEKGAGRQAGSSTDLKKIQDLGRGGGQRGRDSTQLGDQKKEEVSLDLELDGHWVLTEMG